MAGSQTAEGPDLSRGVPFADIPVEGVVAGRVGDDAVIVARLGGGVVAYAAHCTHYGGPLAQGLRVGDTVRCPWHHACFSLRTGEALAAPAFAPLERWQVEVKNDVVFVRRKDETARPPQRAPMPNPPRRIVIVGGGAAGFAAAEMLRRLDYRGELTMLSADADAPYDRPNLSKDYLAGNAPEDWIPLRDEAFYRDHNIVLRMATPVASIDPGARELILESGERLGYDALLLATGAEPIRPHAPGFDQPNVHTLRSLADSRALIAAAKTAKKAVVIGASFIGLECAASLRKRGIEVDVVAPEAVPMLKVLGADFGAFVRALHEQNGVRFHLGRSVGGVQGTTVHLDDGSVLEADLVVLGVGVRPRVDLAKAAGLVVDNGVHVDDRLRTSVAGIWAAGDIAAYPDPISGERVRVEHWVAAERQGQAAAANMLGAERPFSEPPFFWSAHYDAEIRYVGAAPGWDTAKLDGDPSKRDCEVRYLKAGKVLAAATLGRDLASLEQAAAFEQASAAAT
ncbi:MAG TPA: FAD-dependent oxidoreductase [Caulobacteraceae bacterium]|jgi:NADPH-dependent 2,4-dienoyl-CoA reductase/sulfur reductase-like enzyme/nitrite reductase/ring-hydroxylating ferredoxin subunit